MEKTDNINTENLNSDMEEVKQEQAEQTAEISETDKLKAENQELKDKYLRLYAEFENFRRRTNKEKLELIDTASQGVIMDVLPVVDDFERGIQSMSVSSDVQAVKDGVVLIYNKLTKILNQRGLKEIDCIEKDFDPELHEAITKIPAPKKKLKGKIVDQILKGYYLKDKVIRHSKVVVGE